MKEYMMLMKSGGGSSSADDWAAYIEKLVASGKFRGGSSLGNGFTIKKGEDARDGGTVGGFMRFEAESIDEVRALLDGNPAYESGAEIEIHELVKS